MYEWDEEEIINLYHQEKSARKVAKIIRCDHNTIDTILNKNNIKDNYECLVIGLGNKKSTPDALGPMVIDNILVTRHLFELNADVKEGIRKVSAIIPGVMGNTGIETIDIIKGIVENVKPKFIIVIDSLCASSIERLNKTRKKYW